MRQGALYLKPLCRFDGQVNANARYRRYVTNRRLSDAYARGELDSHTNGVDCYRTYPRAARRLAHRRSGQRSRQPRTMLRATRRDTLRSVRAVDRHGSTCLLLERRRCCSHGIRQFRESEHRAGNQDAWPVIRVKSATARVKLSFPGSP